jgi:hypothetical protein
MQVKNQLIYLLNTIAAYILNRATMVDTDGAMDAAPPPYLVCPQAGGQTGIMVSMRGKTKKN